LNHDDPDSDTLAGFIDDHPIAGLMRDADKAWQEYEEGRSTTFKETVSKYRTKYGRNPPPGFQEWYQFARDKNVHNVDDFEQIMDDLRPFWGIEPSVIRSLAAHMSESKEAAVSGIHIRKKKIWKLTNSNWRTDTFAQMLKPFVHSLPDMDIALNNLDQPRVVVPWSDMQALLAKEVESRRIVADAPAEWTNGMTGLLKDEDAAPIITDPKWFNAPGQQYMLIAKEACPPDSHARDGNLSSSSAEALYKEPIGGFVNNFNRSSDLCVIGPGIENKHGFLYASSTVVASKSLLPIFGECKVNVNSDILFPANMYYKDDSRYDYAPEFDYEWADKKDVMLWRGVTSGGTNTADNWHNMHRQRLVMMSNATVMANNEVRVLNHNPDKPGTYEPFEHFKPSEFTKEHTDVGFTEAIACIPSLCPFYDDVWTYKNQTSLSQQFSHKFLIDVDGHSYSGRWRAFLQSKSLGIKSTIFREWHDSRLFAWRHFVPLDYRYDEVYSLLTYFIGFGNPSKANNKGELYIPRHESEGRKLGRQGREWASKALRKEDMEVRLFSYFTLAKTDSIIRFIRIGYLLSMHD
jgi:hypothetical protein